MTFLLIVISFYAVQDRPVYVTFVRDGTEEARHVRAVLLGARAAGPATDSPIARFDDAGAVAVDRAHRSY